MGPMLMFDKSALQCVSLNESVFIQHFFLTNITPLFYIETLADLEKEVKGGKTPEQVVGELASKTPEQGVYPNMFHGTLLLHDLFGDGVEMSRRPFIKGGVPKISPDGKIGFFFDELPEKKAMQRVQNREFMEIERGEARSWRQALSNLSFETEMAMVKNIVPPNVHFHDLKEIKEFVDKFVLGNDKSILELSMILLDIPEKFRKGIRERWNNEEHKSFSLFAPYASYVLTVDLVFYLGLIQSFISKDRPSNKIDLSYLYYLPFCMIFVSSDKLHERTVPLFLKKGQMFVKGQLFKDGLKELDDYYSPYIEEIAKKGLMSFAPYPPQDKETIIGRIWDTMGTKWRQDAKDKMDGTDLPTDEVLLKLFKDREKNSIPLPNTRNISSDDADHVTFTHKVHVQKGKWRILPEGIENKTKSGN